MAALLYPLLQKNNAATAAAEPAVSQPYHSAPGKTLQLLLCLNDRELYALCTLNGKNSTLDLQLLPENSVQKSSEGFDKNQPVRAAERFFSCEIDRYVFLSDPLLSELADECGGVCVTVQAVPAIAGEMLIGGEQTVCVYGAQLLKLLRQPCADKADFLKQNASLLGALMLRCLNSAKEKTVSLLSSGDTNISKADLVRFAQYFPNGLTAGEFSVCSGIYMGENYYLY